LKRGRIIVIEGTDKAGKGTQSRLLHAKLCDIGFDCKVIDFPDYSTPIGQEINLFLRSQREYPNEVKHLLLSANRWEKKIQIEKDLDMGITIIMNRYHQSNLAYGIANGIDKDWLLNLDKGLPKEDIVILLEINPETSFKRASKNRDYFEKDLELMRNVHRVYRIIAKEYDWKIVNGEKEVNEVSKEIFQITKSVLSIR
jgi:dTMP kinase